MNGKKAKLIRNIKYVAHACENQLTNTSFRFLKNYTGGMR